MSGVLVLAITVLWTGICAVALGFCLRGYAYARRATRTVEPLDGLSERQARRNLRVERIRVICQVFGLSVGLLSLGARAEVVPQIVVQVTATPLLIGIALALMIDSILDDRYRSEVEREEARLLAATVSPRRGGQRKYDADPLPNPMTPLVPPEKLDPPEHRVDDRPSD